jgi:hypothetical protein
VKLSRDELKRLEAYGSLPPPFLPFLPDSTSGTMPLSPPGGGSAAPRVPNMLSLGKDTVPGSGASGYDGTAFGADGSSVLQALYATDAVKQAFARLSERKQTRLNSLLK